MTDGMDLFCDERWSVKPRIAFGMLSRVSVSDADGEGVWFYRSLFQFLSGIIGQKRSKTAQQDGIFDTEVKFDNLTAAFFPHRLQYWKIMSRHCTQYYLTVVAIGSVVQNPICYGQTSHHFVDDDVQAPLLLY